MTPNLQISQLVINRLKNLKNVEKCGGGIFGLMYKANLIIMGFDLESSDKLNFKKMQDNFPTEIDLIGIFKFGECSDAEAHMQEILSSIDITDNPILLKCNGSGDEFQLNASQYRNGKLESIEYEIVSEETLISSFLTVRLKGYVEIEVPVKVNKQNVKNEFMEARKKLALGNVIFQCENRKIFFNTNNVIGIDEEAIMLNLLPAKKKDEGKKSKSQQNTDFQTININCLIKKSDESDKNQRATLNFVLDHQQILIPIKIDAVAALHVNTKVTALYDILVESLCRTLRLIEVNLLDQLEEFEEILVPSTFHFKPDGFGHFYTCIYPDSIPDDDNHLTSVRKELHQQLGIPLTRPVFRRSNNFLFEINSNLLVNPHVGLRSTVDDGKQSLVHGKYSYHHYMQDNFNDDGWGCAYRSLQTLCSWFRFQGFSTHSIPTHEEIQKYLVKVGDKPSNFVNSRQWIGSTEVSMCLNGFMQVDSRIMHVSTGSELASKGSELAYHFETQGTPIMIGGGVLAHTILGVDFNSNTGELKFLILDPHFTGADDLQVVQNKGWCGWKGTNFWDKNSYYNLCLPQKPKIF